MESAGGGPNPIEQFRLGCGHPHLAATFEAREQSCAALRIEVRCYLVEEQNRRLSAAVGDELGVREHKPEEQRLLLAGGGACRRHPLGAVKDGEVLPVGAFGRSSGRGVTLAVDAEQGCEV